jgi:hypothetical protein
MRSFRGPYFRLRFAATAMASLAIINSAGAAEPPETASQAGNAANGIVSDDLAHAQWQEAMMKAPRPPAGCFQATFPGTSWEMAPCLAIGRPTHPMLRRTVSGAPATTGNGNDYVLSGSSLISATTGSFPSAKGLKSESTVGGTNAADGANNYTLQLNTNDNATTSACSGGAAGCRVWQQFIFTSNFDSGSSFGINGPAVFMQYWLLGYGSAHCPSGYSPDNSDNSCFMNSQVVQVPSFPITGLSNVRLEGTANSSGDSAVFINGSKMYGTSGADTVLNIATVWKQSEFNIFGDFSFSEAVFNPGASLNVSVAASTASATCVPGAGTTGETSNLILSSCFVVGGSTPSILFREFMPTKLDPATIATFQLLL